ncbi:Osteoclast-stimulating factor 1 [Armadillidium nasatum]|uniref:Osteoclast-stimulating factor 1 n=1 Tax=Armadillidium nasatum TaxID=96803 RepID=A0A5N5TFD9_9CRUS|nr:Osteoclast-stimulating factor 1 [Armadillidium nasatum]
MANRTPVRSAPAPPPLRKGSVQAFEALYSYKSTKPNELSFEEGDLLYVLDQSNANWWLARQDKSEGLIPSSFANGISVNSLDKTGASALHAACMAGHLEAVERLLREPKIEINLQNKLGDTPLHNASIRGHHEICQLLLSRGASRNLKNIEGETPQSLAKNSLVKGVFDNDNEKRISHLAEEGPDVDYNSEEDSD